jgi:hypothetical protein
LQKISKLPQPKFRYLHKKKIPIRFDKNKGIT